MPLSYKNQLQQHALRQNLGFPMYTIEADGPPHDRRFNSKVRVGGISYGTLKNFPTRKEAEQSAAKVACETLLETTDEGSYKNLLQEFAQKRSFLCPSYETATSGFSHYLIFVSTVEIGDDTFQGTEAKTKKQAEMHAAKVAYCTLITKGCVDTKSSEVSCIDECPVVDSLSSNIQPTATTKKHQDTSYEDNYLHAKRAKASTESTDGNTLSSNSPSIVSNVMNSQVENSSPVPVPTEPAIEWMVGNEQLLQPTFNTLPSNSPSIVSNVMNSQVENSSPVPAPTEPVVEQMVGNELLLQPTFKTVVFPRKSNLPIPEGATMMPYSDVQWVAYKIDLTQAPMV